MSPNLYDLLDVDESASADEIRAAWKTAIADLDPTDRRFRAYNDAAGVLLDETKRSAYDAGLAADRADEVDEAPAEVPVGQPAAAAPASETEDETDGVREDVHEDVDEPEEPVAAVGAVTSTEPARSAGPAAGPPLWTLVLAGVAALLAVAAAAWAVQAPDVKPQADAAAQLASADATVEQLVADKIVPAMSYDYRTIDADSQNLQQYLTPTMAAKQKRLWTALGAEAKKQHIVVTWSVATDAPGTGLTRVSDDGTRALVVAFIQRNVTKLGAAPATLPGWASFSLVKSSTGQWQVDDVCTERDCG